MITRRIPDRGESVQAIAYRQNLGGKGANAAIATDRACHKKPVRDEGGFNGEQKLTASLKQPGSAGECNWIHVKMIGAVGDDEHGDRLIAALHRDGVDTSGIVAVANTRTSRCFELLEHPMGENR